MMATSTITRTEPSIEGEYRIPAVEANLLPVEIVEGRRGRLARRVVISALVFLVLLTTAWYGQARYQTSGAEAAVRFAENDTQRVVEKQRAFNDLVATRAETQAINTRLSGVLAADLNWGRLLFAVRMGAPKGVSVTSIVGALNDEPAAAALAAARTPGATIGRLTVSGTGGDKASVASFVDQLAKVPGLGNPLLTSATNVSGSVLFAVQLDITTQALGGRYTTGEQ
jgi:hypothetical protein